MLVDLVAKILALVPPWTRVYRVQRDIPMPLVTSGVEHGNLRELALARMGDLGTKCRDVRTREVGIQEIHNKIKVDEVEFVRRDYTANGGWESFLVSPPRTVQHHRVAQCGAEERASDHNAGSAVECARGAGVGGLPCHLTCAHHN